MRITKKIIVVTISIIGILLFSIWFSSAIGWYGYEKWKYRRSTFGNKDESIARKVFVKNLNYMSNTKLDSFDIYIEKGFKYGYHSSEDTRMLENDEMPFQVTFTDRVGLNNISYYIINKKAYDSITATTIYSKKPFLEDTLLIGIDRFNSMKQEWDSIGYIKVYNK